MAMTTKTTVAFLTKLKHFLLNLSLELTNNYFNIIIWNYHIDIYFDFKINTFAIKVWVCPAIFSDCENRFSNDVCKKFAEILYIFQR